MIDFIPLESYSGIFFNVMLVASLFALMGASSSALENEQNLNSKKVFGLVVLFFCLIYIGLRPISGKYFGDMRIYANTFQVYADGEDVIMEKDVYFHQFMKWSSGAMSIDSFFFICALLYILPMYVFAKRIFKEYWFYGFMALVLSFSFWSFGVNGIRNGISTSMFLMGISFRKTQHMAVAFALALGAHLSAAVIIGAWIITYKFQNSKLALIAWFLAIPMSLALGSFWEGFFLNFGFGEEERLQSYLGGDGSDEFEQEVSGGFRWDFLIYSGIGVFTGWYFIIKRKFADVLYTRIYIFYLGVNAFWVLVIRATFSNRFAYLSWFILGVLVVYPFLKMKFFRNQHVIVARVLFGYFLITYLLNFVIPRLK